MKSEAVLAKDTEHILMGLQPGDRVVRGERSFNGRRVPPGTFGTVLSCGLNSFVVDWDNGMTGSYLSDEFGSGGESVYLAPPAESACGE